MHTPTCINFFLSFLKSNHLSMFILSFSVSSVFLFSICLFIQFVTASSLLFFFFHCPDYTPPASKPVTSSLPWHWWHHSVWGCIFLYTIRFKPVRTASLCCWVMMVFVFQTLIQEQQLNTVVHQILDIEQSGCCFIFNSRFCLLHMPT